MTLDAGVLLFYAYSGNDVNGTTLGPLTDAYNKRAVVEDNGLGGGVFDIHPSSSQVAWVAQGNYVKVWRNAKSGDPLCGFWIDTSGDTLVSNNEDGSLALRRGGPGSIAVMREAIVWHKAISGASGQVRPKKGDWHWTEVQPAAVIVRLIEEAHARGALADVTYDFTRTKDSDKVNWDDDEFDEVSMPIGINLLEVIANLRDTGLHVRMDGNLVLSAWTEYENDLSGSVAFVAASGSGNVREATERNVEVRPAKSIVLMEGEQKNGKPRYTPVASASIAAALGRRKEGHYRYTRTPSPKVIKRIGNRKLRQWKRRHDGPPTIGVIDEIGQVALVDYREGDTVALTIPNVYTASPQRISAITLADKDGAGEYDPIIDFAEGVDPLTGQSYAGDSSGLSDCGDCGGGVGGKGGSKDGGSTSGIFDVDEQLIDPFDTGAVIPSSIADTFYIYGSSYGPTIDGVTTDNVDDDSGFITSFIGDGFTRTTWLVNPAATGWSETHKCVADETGVYAQIVGGSGAYPSEARSGVVKFSPTGVELWRVSFGSGFDPYSIQLNGNYVGVFNGNDLTVLNATTGAIVYTYTHGDNIYAPCIMSDGAVWGVDDNATPKMVVINGGSLIGSWTADSNLAAAFFMPSDTDDTFYAWKSGGGTDDVYRIVGDRSTTPTVTHIVSPPSNSDHVSVDPVTREVFAAGGDGARAYTAAGALKWGPVALDIDPGNTYDTPQAAGGRFVVSGDHFDGMDYAPGIAVLAQDDGTILYQSAFGADSVDGWAITGGAVGMGASAGAGSWLLGSADTTASSVDANDFDILLPDVSDAVGKVLVVFLGWYYTGSYPGDLSDWSDLTTILADGHSGTPTGGFAVIAKRIVGDEDFVTDGFLSTSESAATATTVDRMWSHAMLLDNVAAFAEHAAGFGWNGSSGLTSTSLDPTSGWGTWAADDTTLYLSMAISDDAISGEHADYFAIAAGSDLAIPSSTEAHFVLSRRVGLSATESPSARTFGGSANSSVGLVAIRLADGDYVPTPEVVPLWALPGPDVTGSSYPGGNEYQDEAVDPAAYAIAGGKLTLTSNAVDKDFARRLESPGDVLWDAREWTTRWLVSLDEAGDTGDPGDRYFGADYALHDGGVGYRLRLGDGTRAAGVEVIGSAAVFAAKALSTATDYWFEIGYFDGTAKARLYAASADRPAMTAWDVETSSLTSSEADGILLVASIGNDGGTAQNLDVKEWRGGLVAQVGTVVENAFVAYGDGTTVTFSLPNGDAAVPGTLKLKVDGVDVTPTARPTPKTFTLPAAPFGDPEDETASSVIRASYEKAE